MGSPDGKLVAGLTVGGSDGTLDGEWVGVSDGNNVGVVVGRSVGDRVGLDVGEAVGGHRKHRAGQATARSANTEQFTNKNLEQNGASEIPWQACRGDVVGKELEGFKVGAVLGGI